MPPRIDGRSAFTTACSLLALLLSVVSGCSGDAASLPSPEPPNQIVPVHSQVAQPSSAGLRGLVEALIDGRDSALSGVTRAEGAELQEFYQPDHLVQWINEGGRPTGNARDALSVLNHAADEGLAADGYYQGFLSDLTARLDAAASPPLEDRARFDVAMSVATLRYLRHVDMGRVDPTTIGFRLEAPRDRHDFPALLRAAMAGRRVTNLVADLRPRLAQYRLLRALLPRYRSLATDPTLAGIPPFTTAVHPGDRYTGIDVLQHHLIALGDLPTDTALPGSGRYEGALVDGVTRFQIRHGLDPDGVLGRATIAALRVPLAWRVRQIELALERMRWVPHLGGKRLVAINIPMFRLWAWNTIPPSGAPLFGMDVIVGRALNTQTPVFVEEMREVTFRPYWNVPRSILRKEVLPKLERDANYLQRENMEIVRGAGDRAQRVGLTADALAGLRQGVLRVRQRPGPKNALGLVKFVFPNQEDVYMHGTPAQALFAKSRRDFSHGCVRVADPIALAEWVLQDQAEWTRDRIIAATIRTPTTHVKLPRPIPVILFYTTAAVMPEDGTIRFAEDIYHHDARLDRALARRQAGQ